MSREYKTILDLVRSQVITDNDPVFVGIGTLDAEHLADMRRRRWLTLHELVELYKWKEGGRNRHLKDSILSNPDELIRFTYDTVGTSITAQLKEGATTQFMVHLDSVLDQIGQLPLEQQEVLADVLHRRRIEQVREQIAANARESLALFHAGKLQARPVEEVIPSLEAALAEPDDE